MTDSEFTYPFSIGSRTINKDFFGMPIPDVWDIMSEQLHFAVNAFDLKIHLFVLMSNHFHMIGSARPDVLSSAMQFMLTQTSRLINKSTNRINHTWRSRYFRRKIGCSLYYRHAYKYFYRNPVEAGLCVRVEDYPYSTLHGLLGRSHLLIPMTKDDLLFDDVEGCLRWLNTRPEEDHIEAVARALRRSEFKLPKKSLRPHPLECLEF